MSIFPTTRIGRALVVSAVVVGVAKIVPFLLQVFSLTGDELTELPPLTPAGTDTTFLLANPVAWFLAVAAAVYVALALRDVVVHLAGPPPSRRPRPRGAGGRSATRRPAAKGAAARRPAAGGAGRRSTPTGSRAAAAKAAKPTPRSVGATRSAGKPAPRAAAPRTSTTSRRPATTRRPTSRR